MSHHAIILISYNSSFVAPALFIICSNWAITEWQNTNFTHGPSHMKVSECLLFKGSGRRRWKECPDSSQFFLLLPMLECHSQKRVTRICSQNFTDHSGVLNQQRGVKFLSCCRQRNSSSFHTGGICEVIIFSLSFSWTYEPPELWR